MVWVDRAASQRCGLMAGARKWDMHWEARDWRWEPRRGADDQELKQWVGEQVERRAEKRAR